MGSAGVNIGRWFRQFDSAQQKRRNVIAQSNNRWAKIVIAVAARTPFFIRHAFARTIRPETTITPRWLLLICEYGRR